MATPRERLEKICSNYITSRVVFKVVRGHNDNQLMLGATPISPLVIKANDDELQQILAPELCEVWDAASGRNVLNKSIDTIFNMMRNTIIRQYERYSNRCKATKRKTENFIQSIQLDDKFLPAYLVSMYIAIMKPDYGNKSIAELDSFFEPLESLRKTYGKRS